MKTIEKAKSLEDVEDRIREILEYCKEIQSPLGYFAALYTRVAKNIESSVEKGIFDDNKRLAVMDVNFVNYYIDAMNCAFNGKPAEPHWQIAIDASRRKGIIVLEHLFVAMNAHINYDLANAVSETVQREEIIDFKGDFMKVNGILFALLDSVQENVANIFHPLKWYLRIGQKLNDKVIRLLMGHMRDDAFAFTCTIALCTPEQRKVENKERMNEVVELSNSLINHKQWWIRIIIWLIRILEVGTVRQKIEQNLK